MLPLLSVSKKTLFPQIRSTICSRVTSSPRCSTRNSNSSIGMGFSFSGIPAERNS